MMHMSPVTQSGWLAFTGGRFAALHVLFQSVLVGLAAITAGTTGLDAVDPCKSLKAPQAYSAYVGITDKPVRSWWVHPLLPPGRT